MKAEKDERNSKRKFRSGADKRKSVVDMRQQPSDNKNRCGGRCQRNYRMTEPMRNVLPHKSGIGKNGFGNASLHKHSVTHGYDAQRNNKRGKPRFYYVCFECAYRSMHLISQALNQSRYLFGNNFRRTEFFERSCTMFPMLRSLFFRRK